MKPLAGKYFAEVLSREEKTESGLILSREVKEVPHKALILACGGDKMDNKGKVVKQCAKVGDTVHFRRIWNRSKKVEGKEYLIVLDEEIVGIE